MSVEVLALERRVIEEIGQKARRQKSYENGDQAHLLPEQLYHHYERRYWYVAVPAATDLLACIEQQSQPLLPKHSLQPAAGCAEKNFHRTGSTAEPECM